MGHRARPHPSRARVGNWGLARQVRHLVVTTRCSLLRLRATGLAASGGISHGGIVVPHPEPSAKPRLAAGCRWSTQGEDRVVLYPEGMIRLQGTGQAILELCDGGHSLDEIVSDLS